MKVSSSLTPICPPEPPGTGLELGVALVGSAIPAPHASVDAVPSAVFLSLAHAARRLRVVYEAASASA